MKKIPSIAIILLISISGFCQNYYVPYNTATSNAFDGISGDCTVAIKISTTQNGIYIDHHLQNFDLKILRIAKRDIRASEVPSYAILDKRINISFDLYVNNVYIERYGQPSVGWATLQGLSKNDGYKPATKTNGYKLFNSGAITVRNVIITKLNYRVKEDYYMQIRKEIAGENNGNTSNNPVKNEGSTNLSIENSSNNNNLATQNSTINSGIPVNTSGNDPLAHFETDGKNYSNPMTNSGSTALDNFNIGNAQGQQIADVATSIVDLFIPSLEEQNRNEQSEIASLIESDRKYMEAAAIKATKLKLIVARKALVAKFPDGKTPLSSQAKGVNEVYYFVYSYQAASIENSSPPIYISNVFSLVKYSDGSWPFKASLIENITKTNKGLDLILSGYYLNRNEAVQQQQFLTSEASNSDFVVNNINYESKKSSRNTSESLDYWGNTVKKEQQQSNAKTPATSEAEKLKIKVDYWGNIVRE